MLPSFAIQACRIDFVHRIYIWFSFYCACASFKHKSMTMDMGVKILILTFIYSLMFILVRNRRRWRGCRGHTCTGWSRWSKVGMKNMKTIPVLIIINIRIKSGRKLISEDEEEIMKRQRKGRVEEDEVIEHSYKKKQWKICKLTRVTV